MFHHLQPKSCNCVERSSAPLVLARQLQLVDLLSHRMVCINSFEIVIHRFNEMIGVIQSIDSIADLNQSISTAVDDEEEYIDANDDAHEVVPIILQHKLFIHTVR